MLLRTCLGRLSVLIAVLGAAATPTRPASHRRPSGSLPRPCSSDVARIGESFTSINPLRDSNSANGGGRWSFEEQCWRCWWPLRR